MTPTEKIRSSFAAHFGTLDDPRVLKKCDHLLLDILLIAVLAVICGADRWDDIEEFGDAKVVWLRTLLALPNGIPSADTYRRVLARLAPRRFADCFQQWIATLAAVTAGRLIAVDGKTLRGSARRRDGLPGLHLVHAWAADQQLLLGQYAVADKSNEITAIPALLALLDLTGAVVTIDAAGCQTAIAAAIVTAGADYFLAVKDNQPTLHAAVRDHLDGLAPQAPSAACSWTVDLADGHGRDEIRRITAAPAPALPTADRWVGLQSCVRIERVWTTPTGTTTEARHFITTLPHDDATALGRIARQHWSVENQLHWRLDVVFREDASQIYADHGAENFSLLRKIAFTMLQRERSSKRSIAGKRKRAGWDESYLLKVLLAGFAEEIMR